MTKKQKQFLKDYRNKIQTKRLNLVLPMELVDWIGEETARRDNKSFTETLRQIIIESKNASKK